MSEFFDIIYCKSTSSERKDIGKCYVKAPAFCGANIGDIVEFKGNYVNPEFIAEGKILFVATTSEEESLIKFIRLENDYFCTATAIYSRREMKEEKNDV
ncbi:MAG: hypothetical protein II702_06665 [Clostridia bacterium]|nr:hypothetical protein [Clostridia bacterium]